MPSWHSRHGKGIKLSYVWTISWYILSHQNIKQDHVTSYDALTPHHLICIDIYMCVCVYIVFYSKVESGHFRRPYDSRTANSERSPSLPHGRGDDGFEWHGQDGLWSRAVRTGQKRGWPLGNPYIGDNTLTGTSKIIRNPSIENESIFLKSYRIVEHHPIHPTGMPYMVIPSSSPFQGSKSSRRSPGSSGGSDLGLSPSLFHPLSHLMGSYLFPLKMVTFHSYVKLPEGTLELLKDSVTKPHDFWVKLEKRLKIGSVENVWEMMVHSLDAPPQIMLNIGGRRLAPLAPLFLMYGTPWDPWPFQGPIDWTGGTHQKKRRRSGNTPGRVCLIWY